jgi:tetratricopeptide (TPR) repeat protein
MHLAWPGNLFALRYEATALVGLGRLADVNAVVEEMARMPQGSELWWHLVEVGLDLRAHGYRKEAQALFEQGIRWIEARPAAEQRDLRADLAGVLSFAGRYDEAWPILQRVALENPDEMDYQASLGTIAARRGDLKEVARIDRWLAGRKGPYLNGRHTFYRVPLAAILGDRDRAVQLFRQAVEEGFGRFVELDGIHANPDFESLRDYPAFQELIRPKD